MVVMVLTTEHYVTLWRMHNSLDDFHARLGVQDVFSSPWEMITVVLGSDHSNKIGMHDALDDFYELFDEFAEQQSIHFHKRNFRELQRNISGLPVAMYGLRGVDCEQLRQFLSGIRAQKYHLQYASVKCGPMTFSFCMGFSCNPDDFGVNGYNRTTHTAYKK
ncbi:hypothetical protein NECAME_17614 [Necator americanus]|uniref:Uncharacterized protein n=1 Tax=Necator americanus TaxID=51031 RepID=W2TP26_NECAM|nr:hypothetical protein NECAME_17614 [Necator americanus]ETN82886.1 hypothetical protein NECAME_17614 [Necator americanus]